MSARTTPAQQHLDASVPVLVLASTISGHSIARSLGRLGIPVYGVYESDAVAVRSRYWKDLFTWNSTTNPAEQTVAWLLELGRKLGSRPVLIPTTDHNCVFMSDYAALLQQAFRFPYQPPGLARSLSNKQQMYQTCQRHKIPTPRTFFPQNRAGVVSYSTQLDFPMVIKGIDSWALRQKTGVGLVVVNDANSLLQHYDRMETP